MSWVSFDPFRTRDYPETRHLKAEHFFQEIPAVRAATRVLFPERWQVNALVFGLGVRIFPSHASYLLGYDKIEMSRAFRAVDPAVVPETTILANTDVNAEETWEKQVLPFVAKLPRSAEGRGVFLIETRDDWRRYCAITDVLYVQELLPIDRDIRIVVIGNEVAASYWRLQSPYGFHNNVSRGGTIDYSPVPKAAIEAALGMARALGVNHAGFDVAVVGGHPYLLEFNRLFGSRGVPGRDRYLRERVLEYLLREEPAEPIVPRAA